MKQSYRLGLWLLAGIVCLPACSNQQLYEAVRENRLQDCERQPPGAVEGCKRDFAMRYEEYERARRQQETDTPE